MSYSAATSPEATAPRKRPIGVFDSGVGGLSVLNEIRRELPGENLIYYADSANCPYGTKTPEKLRSLTSEIAHFLTAREAKLIVVACNTASVAALAHLRATFALPFVGVVPAVKPAAQATRARRVAVLATPATFQGALFEDLVRDFAAEVQIIRQVCPGLVELVERGVTDGPEAQSLLGQYLAPGLAEAADTVVLGCTHYPHLRPAIERIVGPDVQVIDSGAAVARQVRRVLERESLLAAGGGAGGAIYYTSGSDLLEFGRIVASLTGEEQPDVRRASAEDPMTV